MYPRGKGSSGDKDVDMKILNALRNQSKKRRKYFKIISHNM